ncbi:MAG: Crp/Fnr family transcriptional regulator [Actinomycetota bacterium]|nr:Crp/Fnr family transcriptional regulator [Actinomycetota bacterium]
MLTSHSTGGFATTSAPKGFDLKDFEEAGLRSVERRFGPKDTIFTPGDPDDQLYFLLSGTVRLYKIYGDYKEATTALLKDGGVFGKLNLVEGRWQDVFAEAVTESRVAGIQKTSLERAIKSDPAFALKLFSSLSERLRQSDEVIESLLHREVSTRLATLLMNLGERFGERNGAGVIIDVRLTHQDLANMIASTREAVSKVMSEFQRDGVVESRNRRIAIVNEEALAEQASKLSGLSIDGQASI